MDQEACRLNYVGAEQEILQQLAEDADLLIQEEEVPLRGRLVGWPALSLSSSVCTPLV